MNSRKLSARLAAMIFVPLAIVIGVGVTALVRLVDPERSTELESTRRVNGDVIVLAYSVPFPDADRVQSLALKKGSPEWVRFQFTPFGS